jgi:ketol-acid reductoisomerase
MATRAARGPSTCDSGLAVEVFTRADASRDQAEAEGFAAHEIEAASECDVICTLVPDDVIPELPITPKPDALWVLASGYAVASTGSTPIATSAWSLPGCWVLRCVSATWKA